MTLIPPPTVAITQQQLLALLERLLPQGYLAPLRDIGPGYELLQAYAQMFARASQAVAILGGDAQIATAASGVKASGIVQLYRDSPNFFDTPVSGQSGTTAAIVAGAPAGQARISGLSNMGAASVGHFLILDGCNAIVNNGTFEIVSFVDSTTVDIVNAAAVIPDANNGYIVWEEVSRTVIVKAGTVLTTSKGGRDFLTTDDVTFLPYDLGPFNVPVVAVSVGYEWNVPGQVIAADGEALPGEIDTVKSLVEDPPLGDPSIKVSQLSPTAGGQDAALDALGSDRGIARNIGEDVEPYRNRVRFLPDTISPDALKRAIDNILRPVGATFEFIETFDITYQTAWDGPNTVIPPSAYNPNLFCYDDPDVEGIPFRNRWLDESDYRGGVIVIVPNIQPLQDVGMTYDDSAMNISELVSTETGGMRAICAYDVPSDFGFGVLQGGYDGFDLPKQSLYKGLFDSLQNSKPAGVSVAVELRGS